MKRIKIIFALVSIGVVVVTSGCKSIEVNRRGSSVAVTPNGQIIKDKDGNPIILDNGWTVEYFQHFNWQEFDGLTAKAGAAVLEINKYRGGADASNIVGIVNGSFSGGAQLALAISEAYAKIAGGAAVESSSSIVTKIVKAFAASGGNADKATVTEDGGKIKVSDGEKCIECDAQGNCAECSPPSN